MVELVAKRYAPVNTDMWEDFKARARSFGMGASPDGDAGGSAYPSSPGSPRRRAARRPRYFYAEHRRIFRRQLTDPQRRTLLWLLEDLNSGSALAAAGASAGRRRLKKRTVGGARPSLAPSTSRASLLTGEGPPPMGLVAQLRRYRAQNVVDANRGLPPQWQRQGPAPPREGSGLLRVEIP